MDNNGNKLSINTVNFSPFIATSSNSKDNKLKIEKQIVGCSHGPEVLVIFINVLNVIYFERLQQSRVC